MKKIILYLSLLIVSIFILSIFKYFNIDFEFALGGIFGILFKHILEMEE